MTRAGLRLLLFLAFVAHQVPAADSTVAQLLSEAKSEASLVQSDAGTLDFLTSSSTGWQGHTAIIASYKAHIGTLQTEATRLTDARKDASEPQKTAIDRVVPLLREFASSAEAAIDRIDKNPASVNDKGLKDYLKLRSDLAAEFSNTIGATVDYATTMEQLDTLAKRSGNN